MQIEVVSNRPDNENYAVPPLLFIHGMYHAAWCWEDYFLPYFERKGLQATALSFYNHGNSAKRKAFNLLRIGDYVEDVHQVVQTMEQAPILVGHSMGGFVVQKYLEKYKAPGAVLMASVPPTGIWGVTFKVMRIIPGAFLKAISTLNLKHIINTNEKYKLLLCSESFDDQKIVEYQKKINTESFLAYIDMLGLDLVRKKKHHIPFLVIGGGQDKVLSKKTIIKTAKNYKTEAIIFEEVSHMMMLSDSYDAVADKIIDWVAKHFIK